MLFRDSLRVVFRGKSRLSARLVGCVNIFGCFPTSSEVHEYITMVYLPAKSPIMVATLSILCFAGTVPSLR